MFEGIDWSTGRVLEQTIARAAELSLPVHLLPIAYDVDDRDTLRQLCRDLVRPNDALPKIVAPATTKFLREFVRHEGRERIWPDQIEV
jgi:hypothetical protein